MKQEVSERKTRDVYLEYQELHLDGFARLIVLMDTIVYTQYMSES